MNHSQIPTPEDANPQPTNLDPKGAIGKTKPQLHLIPLAGMEEQAKAHVCGSDKYGEKNWRSARVRQSTYISAILRHIGAFQDGEDTDPESEAHHLGHAMANCAIILDAMKAGTLVDDRVKMPNLTAPQSLVSKAWDEYLEGRFGDVTTPHPRSQPLQPGSSSE